MSEVSRSLLVNLAMRLRLDRSEGAPPRELYRRCDRLSPQHEWVRMVLMVKEAAQERQYQRIWMLNARVNNVRKFVPQVCGALSTLMGGKHEHRTPDVE